MLFLGSSGKWLVGSKYGKYWIKSTSGPLLPINTIFWTYWDGETDRVAEVVISCTWRLDKFLKKDCSIWMIKLLTAPAFIVFEWVHLLSNSFCYFILYYYTNIVIFFPIIMKLSIYVCTTRFLQGYIFFRFILFSRMYTCLSKIWDNR